MPDYGDSEGFSYSGTGTDSTTGGWTTMGGGSDDYGIGSGGEFGEVSEDVVNAYVPWQSSNEWSGMTSNTGSAWSPSSDIEDYISAMGGLTGDWDPLSGLSFDQWNTINKYGEFDTGPIMQFYTGYNNQGGPGGYGGGWGSGYGGGGGSGWKKFANMPFKNKDASSPMGDEIRRLVQSRSWPQPRLQGNVARMMQGMSQNPQYANRGGIIGYNRGGIVSLC
jgi:hypothetical protein